MVFEAAFIELLLTVERSECGCQATKRPDQLELRGDDLDDEAEPRLLRKLEAPFGLTLRVCQRIAGCEKIRVQIVAAVRGKREVAGLVRDIERAAHQVTAGANVPRPRHDEIAERHVGSGLVALQSALFGKLIPEPAELEPTRVVVEVRSGDHAEEHIREARCVAVAVLETEIDHPADHQRKQIAVGEQGRWNDVVQDIQRCQHCRVAHQRQVDQVLDAACAETRPDALVFVQCLFGCRMRRPFDSQMRQIFEAHFDGPLALIERRVDIHAQARHASAFDRVCRACRKQLQPLLGHRKRAGQELAFRAVQLQFEGHRVLALPGVCRLQRRTGHQILQRRRVGRGCLGALAGQQIELGHLLALVSRGDQRRAAVELIDDVEDRLLPLLGRDVGREPSPDSKVRLVALRLRDQRVGGFLNAIVDEPVGAFQVLDQLQTNGLPEIRTDVLG